MGGLPPINSSWRQAPWGSRKRLFFVTEPLRSQCLCTLNVLSDEKMDVSLMKRLRLSEAYVSHIQHVTEDYSLYTIYRSSVSPGLVKKIMSILYILRYNDCLVTWTVVSLAAVKFKPLVFSLPRRLSLYSLNKDRISSSIVFAGRCLAMSRLFIESFLPNGQKRSSHVTTLCASACPKTLNDRHKQDSILYRNGTDGSRKRSIRGSH
jgi:hypothetical protein